ncbi:MAG: glycosyltransferase family 2 protein [Betaproteobacteria bacterium]
MKSSPGLPAISVLLPVHNGAQFIREAIDSVIGQLHTDWELIIGDNCSTDATPAILAACVDPRIRVIRNERNLGVFGNLNRLVSRARAPIVRFLCHDDVLRAECLVTELDFIARHGECLITVCCAGGIDPFGRPTGNWAPGIPGVISMRTATLQFLYYGCWAGNISTVCVRKAEFERLGGFDEKLRRSADWQAWVRLVQSGPLGDIGRNLVWIRDTPGRLSRSGTSIAISEDLDIIDTLLSLVHPEDLAAARKYVAHFHDRNFARYVLSLAAKNCWREAGCVLGRVGSRRFLAGLFWLLASADGRVFRPPIAERALRH